MTREEASEKRITTERGPKAPTHPVARNNVDREHQRENKRERERDQGQSDTPIFFYNISAKTVNGAECERISTANAVATTHPQTPSQRSS